MTRRLLLALAITCAVASVTAWSMRTPFDRAAWQADYDQLRSEMEQGYANLEWIARSGVDPVALHRRTLERLAAAESNGEARAAIADFLGGFDDGHLGFAGGPPAPVAWAERQWKQFARSGVTRSSSSEDACDAFGYGAEDNEFGLPFEVAGSMRLKSGTPFRSALVNTADGRGIGVVRIPLFSPQAYRAGCEAVWPAHARALAAESPCDEECEYALQRAAGEWLARRLDETIMQLDIAGAVAVVVDITGNGGGSEWVDVATRAVTSRPIASPRTVVLRHPHARTQVQARAERVAKLLGDPSLTDRERDALVEAEVRLTEALAMTFDRCDMAPIWTSGVGALDCANVAPGPLFASGPRDNVVPGSIGRREVEEVLFGPAGGGARPGRYKGPLLVLVDRHTASAAEQFTAMLQDAGAATVIGERTGGAGCGFTAGGIPHMLRNSGLRVRMPDCARLRADGSNEVAGITPDILLRSEIAPESRAKMVVEEALKLAR